MVNGKSTLLHRFSSFFNTASITIPPLSVSVIIYTMTNFTCKWSVQQSVILVIKIERSVITNNISVDVLLSVLTIRALSINEGIYVGCIVISLNLQYFQKKGATLTVKG